MPINIAAVPATFLDRARNEGIDALGQPVRRVVARAASRVAMCCVAHVPVKN
jgi:hypothetical protein